MRPGAEEALRGRGSTPWAGMRRRFRRRAAWSIAWGVATIGVVVFARSIDLRSAWRIIAGANVGWVGAAIAANFLMLPLMSEQWFRLAAPHHALRRSAMWECVTLGMAAMNVLPFGGGHAVAVALLAQRGAGIGGGIALMALEQFCDAFAKLGILLLAITVVPLPPVLHTVAWVAGSIMLASFVVLRWLGTRRPRAAGWRARWAWHLQTARRPAAMAQAIGLSLLIRGCGLMAIYATQRALGVEVPFRRTPAILAVVIFATAMAISPGNLGVYEVATSAAYRLLGVPAGAAAALGIVQHACFLAPIIATAYGLTVWRALKPRRAMPVDTEPAQSSRATS